MACIEEIIHSGWD